MFTEENEYRGHWEDVVDVLFDREGNVDFTCEDAELYFNNIPTLDEVVTL